MAATIDKATKKTMFTTIVQNMRDYATPPLLRGVWGCVICTFLLCTLSTAQTYLPPQAQRFTSALHTASYTIRGKDITLIQGFALRTMSVSVGGTTYVPWTSPLVAVYPVIGNASTATYMNWLSPGTSHSTNYYLTVGTGAPVTNDGYITPSGGYLLTGYTRASMAQNSRHMYFFSRAVANSASDVSDMGAYSSATPYDILRINFANTGTAYGYSANASGSSYSNTTPGGGYAVNRNSATSVDIFKNGTAVSGSPFTNSSSAVTDVTEFSIFAGFNAQLTTRPGQFFALGGSLTTTQLLSEYNASNWLNSNK